MISILLFWIGIVLLASCSLLFLVLPAIKLANTSKIKVAALSALLVVGQLSLYLYWGSSQEFQHVKAYEILSQGIETLNQTPAPTMAQALEKIKALSDEVDGSHKALARLSEVYTELGEYTESIALLEKAMALSPETSEYVLQWIYHQAFLHQGKLPDSVRKRAELLAHDPKAKLSAMNMLAMDDFFQGNYQAAIDHWKTILNNDKTLTTERRLVLEKAVANAKAKMVNS